MTKKLSLLLVFALLVAVPAFADTKTKTDGNDAKSPFDIKKVKHDHDGSKLVHKLWTYEAWNSSDLSGSNYIAFRFSLPGSTADYDRVIEINYRGGRLKATMYDTADGTPSKIDDITVSRPGTKSVKVKFGKGKLESGIEKYQWQARSLYDDENYCGAKCLDLRPNDADTWITHKDL